MRKALIVSFVIVIVAIFASTVLAQQKVMIKYSYKDTYHKVVGIATGAKAYLGNDESHLLADASVVKIEPGKGGYIEIEETHYYGRNFVVYKGRVRFSLGIGSKISESSIKGRKRADIFSSWPAGM